MGSGSSPENGGEVDLVLDLERRVKIEPDIDAFTEALRRLGELQGKTQREVVLDQGALWCRDAIKLLPPFGKTPLKESAGSQKKVGETAVGRDVDRIFRGMDSVFAIVRKPEIAKVFKRIATTKNALKAEAILRDVGFKKVAGVVERPDKDKHNNSRNAQGRARKGNPQWFAFKSQTVERFKKAKRKTVGIAKAGFLFALYSIDSLRGASTFKPPAWVARHRGMPGSFLGRGSDNIFEIKCSNDIPFAQKHSDRVEREGWRARMIAAPRQADALYKAMARKAAQLKL